MDGTRPTSAKWNHSETYIYGGASFSDRLSFQVTGQAVPRLTTLEFVWNLAGHYIQIIDIAAGEQPLYRLSDRIHFTANANGLEEEPVDLDATTYDPDAQQPVPAMWSLLDDDVNLPFQPIPGVSNSTLRLLVTLRQDGAGGYLPVDLETQLTIESTHSFLNDGNSLNYFLRGNTEFAFTNSADLVGITLRDDSGAARGDVTVTSAEGVNYTLIVPEPSSAVALACAAGLASAARRRRTDGVAIGGGRLSRVCEIPLPPQLNRVPK
jgi:hypothetical protein